MENDISKLLPSVNPEFFSSPHAWEELDDSAKVDKKPQKQRRKPSKQKPHQTSSASRATAEKTSDNVAERKVKKDLHDIQSKKKGNVAKPLSQPEHKGLKGKVSQVVKSQHLPKSTTEPKSTKLSLFGEVDDWAESGLDGDVEFDFSELPKWD
jgi:hypothetical protein